MVMIPLKWAGELIEKNLTPHDFVLFVEEKTKNWTANDGEYEDYLLNLATAACMAQIRLRIRIRRNCLHPSMTPTIIMMHWIAGRRPG